jgi:diguanylate cyclase (GGDEF)-like protein
MTPITRKSFALLSFAFCLLATVCVANLMGWGQLDGEPQTQEKIKAVQELIYLREAMRDVLLASQRYLLTGEKLQLNSYREAADKVKESLVVLKEHSGRSHSNFEQLRTIALKVNFLLDELESSVQMKQGNSKLAAADLLLSTKELHEASRLSSDILVLEQEEEDLIRANLARDSKTSGDSVPMVILLFSTVCGVFSLYSFTRGRALEPAFPVGQESNAEEVLELKSKLHAAQEQLERLANTDYLTESLNTRGLELVLQAEENRSGRSGSQLVAMLIDCDNFQKVNMAFGPSTGDVVLKEVAKRIRGNLRPTDHVARVGGDEFLVLLPDTQVAYGMKVAERIRASIADSPLRLAQDVVSLTASIGVSNLPPKLVTTSEALTFTRAALRRSKSSGMNKVSLANDIANISSAESKYVDTAKTVVETLLDQNSFRVVYQPVVALATEKIIGYEALTRGPDGAFESPADFFRLCVEHNILTAVDLQCLKLCLANTASRHTAPNLRVHVNLFPSTLLETPIEKLIELFPAKSSEVTYCVEISEQQFVCEPANIRPHVLALKNAGVLVAVDDVGFGRSSLETLILLEPDMVKVDRTYVSGVAGEPAKARLLRRLANVAKSLGSEIVAEGIENRNDLPLLIDMGINYGQGFLWGEHLLALPEAQKKEPV